MPSLHCAENATGAMPVPRKLWLIPGENCADRALRQDAAWCQCSRAMQKMKAGSLPELGRMADKLKLALDKPHRA
jgi:hypothetical protein